MKAVFCLLLLLLPAKSFSQEADSVYQFVDVEATFPGGSTAMIRWIIENIRISQETVENGFTGRMAATFIVEKDRTITHVDVRETVFPEVDLQFRKLLESMPKWVPAQVNGVAVRSRNALPISCILFK